MTAPAKTAARTNVLPVGALIEEQVGRTAIRLMRVTAEAWTVEVYVGSQRITDQCSSFDDEVAAALTASGYFQLAEKENAKPEALVNHAAPLARGEVRTHRTADVQVTVQERPTGGYLVQVRKGGEIARDACRHHHSETLALHHFARLVAAHPQEA